MGNLLKFPNLSGDKDWLEMSKLIEDRMDEIQSDLTFASTHMKAMVQYYPELLDKALFSLSSEFSTLMRKIRLQQHPSLKAKPFTLPARPTTPELFAVVEWGS